MPVQFKQLVIVKPVDIPARTQALWAQREAAWYHRQLAAQYPEILFSAHARILQERRAYHSALARRLMNVR